jgi:peptide/nickel transport system substrate-binding protein
VFRSSVRPAASGSRSGARRRPRRLLATGLCALALLATACGGDSDVSPASQGTPKAGGELTITLPGDLINFDPARSSYENVTDGSRMSALYDVLLWTDPATGSVRPQMAESMASNDSKGENWTLRLRPNIKFSDGTALDAEAVRFNWQRHLELTPPTNFAGSVAQIKTMAVSKTDPLQLDITLKEANANFDRTVSKNLNFIGSPTAIKAGGQDGLTKAPVGAGPFMLESYTKGQSLVLKRNDKYWQADKGLPYLDRVTFLPDIDIQRAIADTDKGKYDMTVTVDPFGLATAKDKGLGTQEINLNGGSMVLFNTTTPPFNNRDARLALAYALSGTEINDQVYGGKGKPARGLFNALSPLANIQLAAPENNPQKAAELFDKVTQNGTKKLEFTYIVPSSPLTEQVARLMQSKLSAYRGVTMNIKSVSIADYIMTVRPQQPTWQAAVGTQWIDDPEPAIYDLLRSSSQRNNSGIKNAEMDAALETARKTTDPEARRDAYTKVQRLLNQEMPFWVYQEAVCAAVFRSKVTGVQLYNDGLILWDRIGLRKGK